jgi:hypothetical protein
MSGIEEIYTEEIHNNLNMYGVWPVDKQLRLGDYGVLKNHQFKKQANIEKFGITFKTEKSPSTAHYRFASKGNAQITFNPKAEIKLEGVLKILKANLDIKFSDENAVFFNAAECSNVSIADCDQLGKDIISLKKKGLWNTDHLIITELINSNSTTTLVSGNASSSILLEAETPEIPVIALANAGIKLNSISEKGIGFSVVTTGGLTPLIGLYKLESSWFNDNFQPIAKSYAILNVPGQIKDIDFNTKQPIELLSFKKIK